MRNSYAAIFWDVDGTLLDFVYSQRYAMTKCFHAIGREITEEELALYARINDDYWKRLELGEITKKELLTGRFLALFSELGIEGVDAEKFRQEYQAALGSVFKILDDSLSVCKSLRGQVKQYVITNGVTATQESKLRLSGLMEVMDGVFISEQIGYPKPQPQFFDYCLRHMEEEHSTQILVVGDSLSSDIKGGIQAGLATCWYNPSGIINTTCYKPDYEISSLHMIYDILKGTPCNGMKHN